MLLTKKGYFYFLLAIFSMVYSCKKEEMVNIDNIYALFPYQSAVVGKIKDGQNFTSTLAPNLKDATLKSPLGTNLFLKPNQVMVWAKQHNIPFFHGHTWFSIVPQAQQLDMVFINQFTWASEFKKLFSTRSYEGFVIYELNDPFELFVIEKEGFVIFTPSKILIEQIIRQTESDTNLMKNPYFTKILNSDTDASMQMFIDLNQLGSLEQVLRIDSSIKNNIQLGQWANISIKEEKEELKVYGAIQYNDSTLHHSNILHGQPEMEYDWVKALPAFTAKATVYLISDYEKYFDNMSRFYPRKFIRSMSKQDLAGIYNGGFGELTFENSKAQFIRIQGQELGLVAFGEILKPLESEGDFAPYEVLNEHIFRDLFGSFYEGMDAKYAVFAGEFIFFTNKKETGRWIVEALNNGDILGKFDQFEKLLNQLPNKANLFSLMHSPNIDKELVQEWGFSQESLSHWQFMAGILSVQSDVSIVNYRIPWIKEGEIPMELAWEFETGKSLITSPALVYNHGKARYNVAFQTDDNVLHLLDANGKELWKIKIGSPILGKIQVLDIFKNGRYQLIFNTNEKLYLYDVKGRAVSPYPLSVNSTLPVEVLDYGNKEYRVFLINGNKVQLYNAKGVPVPGFTYKVNGNLTGGPKLALMNKKEYLLFPYENRAEVVNRLGLNLFAIEDYYPKSSFYTDNNRFIISDNASKIVQYSANGKSKVIGKMYNKEGVFGFIDKKLAYYTAGKLRIFKDKKATKLDVVGQVSLSEINTDIIFIGDENLDKIHCINGEGNEFNGSPISGYLHSAVGKIKGDSGEYVVTADNQGKIYCYKLK